MRRWRRAVAELDLALFERVARRPSPLLDRTLLRLTRAANHSKLWLAIAAGLALLGGRGGRTAAMRGLAALGVAATIANVPAKFGARRHRPPVDRVPVARRLPHQPRTFSFPSGHTASATAFATGVALEQPAIGLPVALLAAGVGYSRVHVGVHYPSDVAAGTAIGIASGLLTLRPWPRESPTGSSGGTSTRPDQVPDARGVEIVVNPGAGDDDAMDVLEEAFAGARITPLGEGDELDDLLTTAVARSDVLGIAGGDGSVRTAATIAARAGRPLLVVPGGTRNHLAAELGIATIADAAAALASGRTQPMDLGFAGDLPFVNTLVLGDYPRMVELRERLESQVGEWPAAVIAVARTLRTTSPLHLEIDGEPRRAWLVFVGNCRYEPHGFVAGWRDSLADGLLDVRLIDADRRLARTRLIAALMTGRLDETPVHERRLVNELRIAGLSGSETLAHDGDATDAPEVLEVTKQPRAVEVLTARQRP